MKLTRTKVLLAALAISVGAAIAVSQTAGKAEHGDFQQHWLSYMTDYLDLTDAQQAQAKQILEKEKPGMDTFMTQMKQTHDQLRQLEMAPAFDEAKVRAAAAQQAQIMTEMTVQKARLHSELYQILTPDQQAKAAKMMERHHGGHWMMHGHDAPPADN